jgi:hypothetical protein
LLPTAQDLYLNLFLYDGYVPEGTNCTDALVQGTTLDHPVVNSAFCNITKLNKSPQGFLKADNRPISVNTVMTRKGKIFEVH